MKNTFLKIGLGVLLAATALNSCRDEFVDSQFFQSVQQSPLNSIEELESFVRGQYTTMRSSSYYGGDFLMIPEVRSDNMYSDFANGAGYYQTVASYSMVSSDQYATNPYQAMYTVLAKSNIIINNQPSGALTWKASQDPAAILQKSDYLKGQAYAIRALVLFDALRLFGQEYAGGLLGVVVPTKYDPTSLQTRSTVAATRSQIEADFDKAVTLMAPAALNLYGDKTTVNLLSVKGLMSRYYIYKGDFAKVRTLVNDVVTSGRYSVVGPNDYARSFTQANAAQNSMFELSVGSLADLGTTSIAYKLLPAPNGYGNMKVLTAMRANYSANDVRRDGITTANVLNGKYLNGFDNIHVLRYEEVLLNGAEAELQPGGSTVNALKYYNLILANRFKASTAIPVFVPAVAVTLDDIYMERRKELIGEGFGYWDLLRLGKPVTQRSSSGVAGTVRTVGNNLLAFPIPRAELNVPGTLVVPNPGYAN
ncbi:RagB/SusD family nutrient uptake outer membrane protein [Chryseobacterium gotjawalense]|uniref:RagB/SusD family nutrient uptake outer membrane protein n=1 Tax=Chryseobacterium gotjawalense TaxID=3042315 RepID=A0ABY8RBF1_9FLAO|nr:RagB/SusD family nutrient uptake outer membrane protein [Chryseobacterium sp. wdc7]WHF50493.1 RagB/SusD family nutrient uptake outer membrane protein [Chryseobacterium sp. wdc7]